MERKIATNLAAVRDSWSEEERRARRDLAGAIQLRLETLVVLSSLSECDRQDMRNTDIASAC
jgi:hypothetical protein